jgi:hypothetical protein
MRYEKLLVVTWKISRFVNIQVESAKGDVAYFEEKQPLHMFHRVCTSHCLGCLALPIQESSLQKVLGKSGRFLDLVRWISSSTRFQNG